MIMTCSLMVYAGIEHLIRQRLTQQNPFFPDMKKKQLSAQQQDGYSFAFKALVY